MSLQPTLPAAEALPVTIDDARGFANVLAKLFSISGTLPKIEATESIYR